jgi:Tfp pilus assembly protein PilF
VVRGSILVFAAALAAAAPTPADTSPLAAGRELYLQGEFKAAIEQFSKAVAEDPSNSMTTLWLARAWGRRAETTNPFQAPGFAAKARGYFERAVELDPQNKEAIGDLFDYYLDAPGFLGGGLDKAARLAERYRILDEAEYHYAMAKVAERRKDYAGAEGQFRLAVQSAPRQAGRLIDLAKFLAKAGKPQESDAAFLRAKSIDPANRRLVFEQANAWIAAKRNLPEARRLLQMYLRMPLTADDPPRSEAEKLLRRASGA